MADEIRIDSLWTLRDLQQGPEAWVLYLNQLPLFESQALRDIFYNSGRPDISVAGDADLLAQAKVLVAEVREGLPEVHEVEGFRPSAILSTLTHYPTGQWAGSVHSNENLRWTRDVTLGGRPFGGGTDSGDVSIAVLSDMSRAAIQRMDALTVETAYRRHFDDLRTINDIPRKDLPPLKKATVFIGYRRSCFDAAKHLHSALQSYAKGTAFSPYLDYHDMRVGDWLAQLLRRIESVDVFMPLVSEDYAAEGTVGQRELEKAAIVAKDRTLAGFFAPVFLGTDVQPAATFLRAFHGYELKDDLDELSLISKGLDQYLGRALTEVLLR